MQLDVLENYLKLVKIEQEDLHTPYDVYEEVEWTDDNKYKSEVVYKLFKLCPLCNLSSDNYTVRFADRATTLIQKLFDNLVDSNTLVVVSNVEHEIVNNILNNLDKNNIYKLYQEDILKLDLRDFIKFTKSAEFKRFKRVVVYNIGTVISSGITNPNIFFKKLRKILNSLNIDFKIILDDVQGMYIVPRDYSVFDYVVGTGHSIVIPFNLGILIQRRNNPQIGFLWGTSASKYLDKLNLILEPEKFHYYLRFQLVMQEVFAEEIAWGCKLNTLVSPNIFSIALRSKSGIPIVISQQNYQVLKEHLIHIEEEYGTNELRVIRIRFQELLFNKEPILEGLKYLQKFLNVYNEYSN